MDILTDLLRAEGAHRHAAPIRYRMSAARLPVVKDIDAFVFENTPINEGLVRSLYAGSFLPDLQRDDLDASACCLTRRCSRRATPLPHHDVPYVFRADRIHPGLMGCCAAQP